MREARVGGVLRDGEDEDVAELVDAAQDDLSMAYIVIKYATNFTIMLTLFLVCAKARSLIFPRMPLRRVLCSVRRCTTRTTPSDLPGATIPYARKSASPTGDTETT